MYLDIYPITCMSLTVLGFEVKQPVVTLLMFSGERMASISVLPVYVSLQSLNFRLVCVRLYCVVCFHYGEAHNGLHQNNKRLQQQRRGLSNNNEVETLSKITLSNSFSLTDFITFICTNQTFLLNY